MSVPNQKIVQIAKRRPWGHTEKELRNVDTFGRIHTDAAQKAARELSSHTYILWTAIALWADGKPMELSCAYMKKQWGFAERTYHRSKNELIEKGYLIPATDGSNILIFFEDGSANLAVDSNNIQENVPCQTGSIDCQIGIDQCQTDSQLCQNDQRNTTNTTYYSNTTVLAAAPLEEKHTKKIIPTFTWEDGSL